MTKTEVMQLLQSDYQANATQLAQLEQYVQQVLTYNQRYNIIGATTEVDIWCRHILDSAQLKSYIALPNPNLLDLGSGAGFPAVVLAILGVNNITLVEKSVRKSEFLQSVIQLLHLPVTVYCQTVAEVSVQHPGSFAYITARAFAPLDRLLRSSMPFMQRGTTLILPKGRKYAEELDISKKLWARDFQLLLKPSITAPDSKIVLLTYSGKISKGCK